MKKYILSLLVLLILVSCGKIPEVTNYSPDYECTGDFNWFGLTPGNISIDNVNNILGEPTEIKDKIFNNYKVNIYPSQFEYGQSIVKNNSYAVYDIHGNVIFLYIVIANETGLKYGVNNFLKYSGNIVDVIVQNGNTFPYEINRVYEGFQGVDQLWIFSNCGFALDTVPFVKVEGGGLNCNRNSDDLGIITPSDYIERNNAHDYGITVLFPLQKATVNDFVYAIEIFPKTNLFTYWKIYKNFVIHPYFPTLNKELENICN